MLHLTKIVCVFIWPSVNSTMNLAKRCFATSIQIGRFVEFARNSRNFSKVCLNRPSNKFKSCLTANQYETVLRQRNCNIYSRLHSSNALQNSSRTNPSSLIIKKRTVRKKKSTSDDNYNVFAYATADAYDLEALHTALTKQDLYETKKFYTEPDEDVLHVRSKINIEPEPRDIFFFRQGSVVMWNCSEPEAKTVLRNLRQFEIGAYGADVIIAEKEVMNYAYVNEDGMPGSFNNETFFIQQGEDGDLEKYTFSNAMTSSVKLGIWESTLDKYIDGLGNVTTDLKEGRKIRMSRATVLRRTGELFALKHLVNLDSDLLETPDFYWDREKLEQLFHKTCSYFSIPKRKRVRFYLFVKTLTKILTS